MGKTIKNIHILMPLCGEGSRFKNSGFDFHKSLISVNHNYLFVNALNSLSEIQNKLSNYNFKLTFIVRQDFIERDNIEEILRNAYPNANVCCVDKPTNGALETLMKAEDLIMEDDYVISIDCDLLFSSKGYIETLCNNITHNIPMLMTFYSNNPSYSYVTIRPDTYFSINNLPTAIRVAEKDTISNYAIGGCYAFGDGLSFKTFAKTYMYDYFIKKQYTGELYISTLFNYIIEDRDVFIYDFNMHYDKYWSCGTPEELQKTIEGKCVWD